MPSEKMLSQKFWPPERYPIAFHDVLEAGSGVLQTADLPWTGLSARKRFYWFLRVSGDNRVWSVEITDTSLIFSSRPHRRDVLREVAEKSRETVRVGVDKPL